MNKNILKLAIVAMSMIAAPSAANAQTDILGGILGAVAGQTTNDKVGTIANVLGNILGTSAVSEQALIGTWAYTQPSIAFESQNVLSQLGGTYASSKIQKKMKKGLEKAGIKPGKCAITFNKDKTFVFTVGSKTQQGTYTVKGSDLTLTFPYTGKTVNANLKVVAGKMQIAMKADKMLQMVNTVATKASAYSSQMGTVAALLGNYSGMYLGMEFSK